MAAITLLRITPVHSYYKSMSNNLNLNRLVPLYKSPIIYARQFKKLPICTRARDEQFNYSTLITAALIIDEKLKWIVARGIIYRSGEKLWNTKEYMTTKKNHETKTFLVRCGTISFEQSVKYWLSFESPSFSFLRTISTRIPKQDSAFYSIRHSQSIRYSNNIQILCETGGVH